MTNTIINVFHNDWENIIKIENNVLYLNEKSTSTYFINNHFLKITWNENCVDYFLSSDENNYYQYCQKYYHIFFKNYSYYFISDKNSNKLYFANHILNICYDLNSIEMYYFFDLDDDKFILYDEINDTINTYINFQNKYYEISYYNYTFKKLYIDNDLFNEITLNLNNNEFYTNKNINGNYQKYGTYLQLNYLNNQNIFILNNDIYEKIKYSINYTSYDDSIDILNNQKTIVFICNNIINNDLLFYLIDNQYHVTLFDNLKNKHQNKIYQNINIIYYKNDNDLLNIQNKINKLKSIKYYYSNLENIDLTNKINLHSIQDYSFLTNIINTNTKHNENNFKKYMNTFSFESLDTVNIQYIKNSKIPKILHFIWIGNNQFPNHYYLFLQSWIDKYEDFIFCFWNDSNLFSLYNQKIYDKSLTYAQKSDIARYEILYNYGGIYVDSDFYSIKNIEELLNNIDMFSAFESDKFIAIGLMGFNKHNNYLKKIILNIEFNYHLFQYKNIPHQTGPVFFTNFHNQFISKYKNHSFFNPSYFYNYTFQNKIDNEPIIFYNNSYCYHSWGYSWDIHKQHQKYIYYFLLKFILNNSLNTLNHSTYPKIDNTNLKNISSFYKNNIFFKKNNSLDHKINIIHVMGYFFTGGIEKFMLNINEYGNHDKYNYILLFLNNKNYDITTNLDNFTCFYFHDNYELLSLLNILNPSLIIDHYSQYIDASIYKNFIYQNITIHVIHSAINYNKNIEHLYISKCIHLYNEENKHPSWNNIPHNYFNSLGIPLIPKNEMINIHNQKKNKIINDKLITIGVIGRIVEEKIPLDFFKKLCTLSLNNSNICIQIFGSQNNLFINEYNNTFNELIKNSNIELIGQIEYNDIHTIYKSIDYLLIPSKFETGSYTCLEALSYGIPIIARNNYGLKKILKNNINGYLLNNDDEIIDKINNLYYDNLNDNYSIIYNQSLKYNIIDKVKNIETIFDKNINNKNLIIITSVLNISKNKLSYYHTRSVFDIHERFEQTKKTIKTIKKYIPNCFIIFCECSNLKYYKHMESFLQNEVDYYSNYYNNLEIKNNINSLYKGLGEISLMLQAFDYINKYNLVFDNIFKISGRYFLNDDFNYNIYSNDNNQFVLWDNNFNSYASLFYKIKYRYLSLLKNCFHSFLDKLKHGETLEILLNQYFNKNLEYKNITILDKHNISGYLSTEGYFFTI